MLIGATVEEAIRYLAEATRDLASLTPAWLIG
jgi:hypothetical protein